MKKDQNLHELYINELKDAYSAEGQVLKAMPKVIKAVSCNKLTAALELHMNETETHRSTVAEIVKRHGEVPTGEHCDGMEGLLKEADSMIEEFEPGPVLDAALISACQKVEHYEIATYGTLRVFAATMGHKTDAEELTTLLDQEVEADLKLTEIAMGAINEDANNPEPAKAGK